MNLSVVVFGEELEIWVGGLLCVKVERVFFFENKNPFPFLCKFHCAFQ